MAEISRDPAFYLADVYDLSKDQIRERTMEKFATLVHYVTTEPLDVFNYRMQVSPWSAVSTQEVEVDPVVFQLAY